MTLLVTLLESLNISPKSSQTCYLISFAVKVFCTMSLVLLLLSVSHANSHIVESHKEEHPEKRTLSLVLEDASFEEDFRRRRGAASVLRAHHLRTPCSPHLVRTHPILVLWLTHRAHSSSYSLLTHLLTLYLPRSPIFLLCTCPILGTPYFHIFVLRTHFILALRVPIFLLRAYAFWQYRALSYFWHSALSYFGTLSCSLHSRYSVLTHGCHSMLSSRALRSHYY